MAILYLVSSTGHNINLFTQRYFIHCMQMLLIFLSILWPGWFLPPSLSWINLNQEWQMKITTDQICFSPFITFINIVMNDNFPCCIQRQSKATSTGFEIFLTIFWIGKVIYFLLDIKEKYRYTGSFISLVNHSVCREWHNILGKSALV